MPFKIINSAGDFHEFVSIIESAIYETNWDREEEFKTSLHYNFFPAHSPDIETYRVEELEVVFPLTKFDFVKFKQEKLDLDEMKESAVGQPKIFAAQLIIEVSPNNWYPDGISKEVVIFGKVWPRSMEDDDIVLPEWLQLCLENDKGDS